VNCRVSFRPEAEGKHSMPVVDVHIVSSTEAPGGIGEASTPGIAPAVANAIFALTGKRIRTLPIKPVDLG